MPKKKAIFLDFDGVLVDSNGIKLAAFEELATENFDDRTAAKFIKQMAWDTSLTRAQKISWLFDNGTPKVMSLTPEHLLFEFSNAVASRIADAERTEDLVRLIAGAEIHACIVSSAPEQEVTIHAEMFGWGDLFRDSIYGSSKSKISHLTELCEIHNRDESVFVGDSRSDFMAAEDAGIPFVFVSDWSNWKPNKEDADKFLGSWGRLEEYLLDRGSGST